MKTFRVLPLKRNLLTILVILSITLSFIGCAQGEKSKLFVFCNDALYALSINEGLQVEKTKITDPVVEISKGVKTKAFGLTLSNPPFFFSSDLISCDMKKIIIYCRYGETIDSRYERFFPVILNIDGSEKRLLRATKDEDWIYAWFAKKEKKYYYIVKEKNNEVKKVSECETQLWRANFDGSAKENLIKDVGFFSIPECSEEFPFWGPPPIIESSDGRKILYFFQKDPYIDPELWIMNSDGSEKRNITEEMRKYLGTEEACILEALFCSNSKKIIMSVVYTDKYGIWIMNIDGTEKKNLTENLDDKEQLHSFFLVSPDNNKILLFKSGTNSVFDFLVDILIMNLDGTDIRNLTAGKPKVVFPIGFIVFSSDGKKIVFIGKDEKNYSLWIMNIDGTSKKDLDKEGKLKKRFPIFEWKDIFFQNCWYPTFSPDGKYIFFLLPNLRNWEEDKFENFRYDLWVVNQDGSEAKNLSELYDLDILTDFKWYLLPD
jgi:Tol biopolymer transport system component